jgi:hypothetical protein
MAKATWRAEFYDTREATVPARKTYIDAETEEEAAEIAAKQMGNCLRVDLTRTVLVSPGAAPSARTPN